MRIIVIIIIISFLSLQIVAQENYFNKVYNYNDFTPALAVIEYDNNYIVYGVTHDSVNNTVSAYITSIDSVGTLNYWKTISESGKEYWAGYRGCGLVSVNNSGFAAAGSVGTEIDSSNAILYRFNSDGDTLWTKQYSDPNEFLRFHDCNSTSEDGFIMTGYQLVWDDYSDVLLIKSDSNGIEQWRREFGYNGIIEKGYSVVQTPDKGFLLGCYSYVAGNDDSGDPFLLKVDSVGNLEWERNLGGPNSDFLTQVCLGNDGSYIAGTTLSDLVIGDNKYSRPKVYKLDQDGEILWEKSYTSTELYNKLYSIYPDHDGGYIAAGRRNNSNHPGHWRLEYGWLLKIDENGDSIWYREYEYYTGTEYDKNELYDVCLAPDGGYTMVGQAKTWGTPQVAWVIKVDSMGCDTPGCSTGVGIFNAPSQMPQASGLYIYPNPATSAIQVRFSILDFRSSLIIYDIYGRKQDEITVPKGQEQTRIDVSGYPSGIYIAVLKDGNEVMARSKFIKSGSR